MSGAYYSHMLGLFTSCISLTSGDCS